MCIRDRLCISTRYLSAITKQVAEDSAKEIVKYAGERYITVIPEVDPVSYTHLK